MLCVSIPGSELEMNPEDQRDYESYKKLLDRVGKPISMSSDVEVTEIIRRRLFDWQGFSDDMQKTVTAYAEWARDNASQVSNLGGESPGDVFRACYPFHPSVLSVFERKWQSLPRFQRTRGILRLLALWVSWAYRDEHQKASSEPLITLGSAPFEDQTFRDAMFEQLGTDQLSVPVTTDIAGKKDAHAKKLDKEASKSIRKNRLHQKVATVIFMESNGGQSQAKADASLPEIRARSAIRTSTWPTSRRFSKGSSAPAICFVDGWPTLITEGIGEALDIGSFAIPVLDAGAKHPNEWHETQHLSNMGHACLDQK